MKMPYWKYLLSYMTDLRIESVHSDFNDNLHLYLSKGRYQLCTDNAIYSFGDLYDNYRDSFSKMQMKNLYNAEILILGFGLGSIPYMLEKKFGLKADYTGVEIDPEVIRMTSKYVLPELKSPIEIIESDAMLYLQWNDRSFDLIASDIFVDDKIPDHYLNEDYIHLLKDHLNTDGCVMLNMLYRTVNDKKLADRFYKESFTNIFPDSTFLKIRDNLMLISNRSMLKEI